ncbi:hypothetical protein JCM8547_008022 [Rhodosporidiobolus lusitaniae]
MPTQQSGTQPTTDGGKTSKRRDAQLASKRAGLEFPVGRIKRYIKRDYKVSRLSATAPVFLAAVLEYLVAEICELAGNASRDNKKSRITPRHLQLAIHNDDELDRLIGSAVIS